jgi:hypothetical protein
VSERGNRERDIAATQREQAAMLRAVAVNAADAADRERLETDALACETNAALHERLAEMYDREEAD